MGSATSTDSRGSHPLRADALRNRERIVAAAREVFVEQGAEAPLDVIAHRAGVGNATLYRHFADRAELVRQVVLSVMDRICDLGEAALVGEPDSFAALRRFVHGAADERIGALCPMLTDDVNDVMPGARQRVDAVVERLIGAARASGQLRAGIGVGDVMVGLAQLTRPLPGSGCLMNDRFVHRHLEIFLDGLMTPARSELPGTAATFEGLRR